MKQARPDAGFSLVEMMMVVAIIGLMTSAVVLVMPSKDTRLQDRLRTTEQAFVALARQSVMTGKVLGLQFRPAGFTTKVLTPDGWRTTGDILKAEASGWQPLNLTGLEVNGTRIDLSAERSEPHAWFLPTGEATAFGLTFSSGMKQATLSVDPAGKTEVLYHE